MDRDRFDKFTERARKVLSLAQEEAQRLNHSNVGTEHVLVGLIREGDGIAAKVLASQEVTLQSVRAGIESRTPRQARIVLGEIGLNDEAKGLMTDAVAAAVRLNHHYIGTEHLLMGLVSRDNVAVHLLRSLGVEPEALSTLTTTTKQSGTLAAPPTPDAAQTPDQIRASARRLREQANQLDRLADRIAEATTQPRTHALPFDLLWQPALPLTPASHEILALATEEARRFNHNYIGTEHLLLGVVRQQDSLAATILQNLGVDLAKVRQSVEFIIGRGDRMVPGEIGLTPRSKRVIELAVDEAKRLGHPAADSEHVLLGLVREGEGIAAGVLESLGVTLERVRTATIAAIQQRDAGA